MFKLAVGRVLSMVPVYLLGAVTLGAQSPGPVPTFRSSIDLVPISAVVRDGRGRFVTRLGARDFEVIDNGVRRPIIDFDTEQTGPITLAVLLDVSGSMRIGDKLAIARQTIERLSAEFRDGYDEAALFTFDAALHERQGFTTHPSSLRDAADVTEAFGTTSMYDAIAATARQLAARPASRRAIVVLTDGVDTSSALTPAVVSGLASSIDAPVYVILTVPPIDQPPDLGHISAETAHATADLGDLARWTGGNLYWPTAKDHSSIVQQIVSELRHQYLIAIESAGEGTWRALDIRVRPRGLTVRARSGYFGRDAQSSR